MRGGWIGVDLDGTLAEYQGYYAGAIGAPIRPMLVRVQEWLAAGREVRLFTARAGDPAQLPAIRQWLTQHGLGGMAITNVKDMQMAALYDDKAVRVKRNSGYVCPGCYKQK